MKGFTSVLFAIFFATLFSSPLVRAQDCVLDGTNIDMGLLEITVQEDAVLFKEWTGVNNIKSVTILPEYKGKYFIYELEAELFAIKPSPEFQNIETLENSGQSRPIITLSLEFECLSGVKKKLLVNTLIDDQNTHAPVFSKPTYTFNLPMPFPSGIKLNEDWGEQIFATDIDISNMDITFTSANADFNFVPTGTDDKKKTFGVVLQSNKPIKLDKPIEIKLTATDTGTKPGPLTSEATIYININEAESYPSAPVFDMPYYEASYENADDAHVINMGDVGVVDEANPPALVTIDRTDYFDIESTGNNKFKLKLKGNIPDDVLSASPYVLVTFTAQSQELADLVAKTVVIVKFPFDSVSTPCPPITTEEPTVCTTVPPEPCECTTVEPTTPEPCPPVTDCPIVTTSCPPITTETPTECTTAPPEPCECTTVVTPSPETCPPVTDCPTDCPATEAPTECPQTNCPTTEFPPVTDCPTTECPTTECPTTDCPTTECPPTESPITECPTTECPATENPVTECPTTECPTTECPATVGPTTEGPTTECPTTECPTTECPTTECPSTEGPTTERPTTECPTTECPTTECPSTEGPTTEGPLTEGPTDCPATDCPVTECPCLTPEPTEPGTSLAFPHEEYRFQTEPTFPGQQLLQVQAVANPTEVIKYDLTNNDGSAVPNGITYTQNGEFILQGNLEVGIFEFTAKATGEISGRTANAKIILTVYASTICEDGTEKPKYSVIVKNVMEGKAAELAILEPASPDYEYVYIGQSPSTPVFTVDKTKNALICPELDREEVAQYEVIVELKKKAKDGRHFNSNVKPVFAKSIFSSFPNVFQGKAEDQCMILDDILNEPMHMKIIIKVEDDNDHSPEFVTSSGAPISSDLIVGYPTKDFVSLVAPPYLAKVFAVDKDVGNNAKIKYSTNNEQFPIHQDTGVIYMNYDGFSSATSFKVTATDQDGNGRATTLNVQVIPLKQDEMSVINLSDVKLEELDQELLDLSGEIGLSVRYLSAAVLPGKAAKSQENSEEEDRNFMRNTRAVSDFVLRIIGYGLDGSNKPVTSSTLEGKIESASDFEAGNLQTFINEIVKCDAASSSSNDEDCAYGGYIAAVVVLCVLLAVLIGAAGAFYYFKLRRSPGFNYSTGDFDEKKNEDQFRHSPEIEQNEPPSKRRPTGFVFNPPPVEDDVYDEVPDVKYENVNEYSEVDKEFKYNRERKKSVTFNENIQKHEIDPLDDEAKSETGSARVSK